MCSVRTRLAANWMNYLNRGEKPVGGKYPPRDERLQSQSCRINPECIQAFFLQHSRSFSRENTYSTSFHICRPLCLMCERVSWESIWVWGDESPWSYWRNRLWGSSGLFVLSPPQKKKKKIKKQLVAWLDRWLRRIYSNTIICFQPCWAHWRSEPDLFSCGFF